MDALLATLARTPVFSHESAALLHGIPVLGDWPDRPQVLDSELGRASRRSPRDVDVHRPRHRPPIHSVDGMTATTPEATALALAASRSELCGLVAVDHVLFQGATRACLEELVADWQPFHGAGRALRVLDGATGRSETPLETISLAGMRAAGIPEPERQVEIVVRGRRYRLDFLWRQLGVAGEADGRLKYGTRDDLLAEKSREDDIRSTGLGLARWDWDDAWARTPMIAKLAGAGVRAAPRSAAYSAG